MAERYDLAIFLIPTILLAFVLGLFGFYQSSLLYARYLWFLLGGILGGVVGMLFVALKNTKLHRKKYWLTSLFSATLLIIFFVFLLFAVKNPYVSKDYVPLIFMIIYFSLTLGALAGLFVYSIESGKLDPLVSRMELNFKEIILIFGLGVTCSVILFLLFRPFNFLATMGFFWGAFMGILIVEANKRRNQRK